MELNGKGKRKGFAVNTVMLYILTFSNFLFSFITVPYQSRVLGPDLYGVIGWIFAVIVYFQVVMDFGFILSGTAEIAKNKNDKNAVSAICESIIAGKVILFVLCAAAMFILCEFVPAFSEVKTLFWICLIYSFMNSMIPDFLYRGLEQMMPITIRVVLIKFIFTIGVFVFVKEEWDYVLVPFLYLWGSLVAVIFAYFDVGRRFGLKFVKISANDVWFRLRASFPFFVSRIASTVTGALNTVLIGFRYSGEAIVGFYNSADKVVTMARQGAAPISDSLYPYLIANRDFRLVKKILAITMPVIICGSAVLFIFAPEICVFVFGSEYAEASVPLRCLIPVIIFVLPNYIFGFPMMTPLHIEKYANMAVVIGALFQVSILLVLFFTGQFNIISLCITTSLTEIVVFVFRFSIVVRTMKKEKAKNDLH